MLTKVRSLAIVRFRRKLPNKANVGKRETYRSIQFDGLYKKVLIHERRGIVDLRDILIRTLARNPSLTDVRALFTEATCNNISFCSTSRKIKESNISDNAIYFYVSTEDDSRS